ncbi:MAG: hypothetical protein ACXQT4_05255 [Methanotrichaceae archaeon]
MNRILPILLLVLLADQAGASVYFKIVDVPEIYASPGEDTNFTVFVQNLGSESTYARLVFRNLPEGMSVVGSSAKWVDSAAVKEFNCSLKIDAEKIPPGQYSFEVGIAAAKAPPGWHEAEVIVNESRTDNNSVATETKISPTYPNVEEKSEEKTTTPGFGAVLGSAAVLLLARKIKRSRR